MPRNKEIIVKGCHHVRVLSDPLKSDSELVTLVTLSSRSDF
jgi:hypothetical protein